MFIELTGEDGYLITIQTEHILSIKDFPGTAGKLQGGTRIRFLDNFAIDVKESRKKVPDILTHAGSLQ